MNRAHRLADQVRSVVGWLNRFPITNPNGTESQFLAKGFLSPAEFVDAGDQLTFQCPTWQWQSSKISKKQIFWLPGDKQYLLTRNIPCRHRVTDWDQSFIRGSHVTSEGWLVPGPQPDTPAEPHEVTIDYTSTSVITASGLKVEVMHHHEDGEDDDDYDDDDEMFDNKDGKFVDEYCLVGTADSAKLVKKKKNSSHVVPTRCYDLSITYDKYYQSPRLWLFGYDESGVPLTAEAVFQDIHSDYLSKTVTVDPHPFTGVPTVSVHPCKHASIMRNVAQNWVKNGIQPRHDLALFLLLKMVSSVVPTINYDFTIDVEMVPLDAFNTTDPKDDIKSRTASITEAREGCEDSGNCEESEDVSRGTGDY